MNLVAPDSVISDMIESLELFVVGIQHKAHDVDPANLSGDMQVQYWIVSSRRGRKETE